MSCFEGVYLVLGQERLIVAVNDDSPGRVPSIYSVISKKAGKSRNDMNTVLAVLIGAAIHHAQCHNASGLL